MFSEKYFIVEFLRSSSTLYIRQKLLLGFTEPTISKLPPQISETLSSAVQLL